MKHPAKGRYTTNLPFQGPTTDVYIRVELNHHIFVAECRDRETARKIRTLLNKDLDKVRKAA